MKYFQTMNRWNIDILGISFAEALGHVWNFTDLKSQASFPKQLLFISQTSSVYFKARVRNIKWTRWKKTKKKKTVYQYHNKFNLNFLVWFFRLWQNCIWSQYFFFRNCIKSGFHLILLYYWSNQHTSSNWLFDWPEGFLSVHALPLELGSIWD